MLFLDAKNLEPRNFDCKISSFCKQKLRFKAFWREIFRLGASRLLRLWGVFQKTFSLSFLFETILRRSFHHIESRTVKIGWTSNRFRIFIRRSRQAEKKKKKVDKKFSYVIIFAICTWRGSDRHKKRHTISCHLKVHCKMTRFYEDFPYRSKFINKLMSRKLHALSP